jgi:hypothetical protein
MVMPPHWLDDVIADAIQESKPEEIDVQAVAAAIAGSNKFLAAIKDGVSRINTEPGIVGPTPAQSIRSALIEAVSAR